MYAITSEVGDVWRAINRGNEEINLIYGVWSDGGCATVYLVICASLPKN